MAVIQEALTSAVVFLGLTLPPGLAALRLLRIEPPPLLRFAVGLGVGVVLVLSALLLELTIGWPVLVLPLFGASMLFLGPIRSFKFAGIFPDLILAGALGVLALLANKGDVREDASGLSVRVGFDISDPAFYGTVAQELERAPIWRLENPAFSPLPLQYTYLPALAGVLLHRYAGIDPLYSFGLYLPALGLFFSGMATAALAQAVGNAGWLGRAVPMVLVAFGGDLSFLVSEANPSWLERTRHFFVFYSFSSESLFYNPWMLGLPLSFVSLLCLILVLRGAGWAAVFPAALVVAALFQTKVFAFIPIWLSVAIYGVLVRNGRLLAVAAASLFMALPGMLLVAPSAEVLGGAPLEFAPLDFVRQSVGDNPSLARLATSLSFPVAAMAIVWGGFGLRLLGLPTLIRRVRAADGAAASVCGLAILTGTFLALTFVGRPTRIDGVQFLFLPHLLLWIFAGSTLGRMLHGPALRPLWALLLLGLCAVTPLRYLATKNLPETLTSSRAMDRGRFLLSPDSVGASRWLRGHSAITDRLVLPLSGDPEDRGGLKPVYVGLLSSRRLVAQATSFFVSAPLTRERQALVERLYETTDGGEADALLKRLSVDWVWEDAARPLRFSSPRMILRAAFGSTRLFRVEINR